MAVNVKIDNFEGPFDLLLHLIRKNKMEIYNIKIYDITKQYLNVINTMKEMDLEITSEFIVIAASLVEIKSKMLLPKIEDEEDDEDPRAELIRKLVEYKKYKKVSEHLRALEENTGERYLKKPEIVEVENEPKIEKVLEGITTIQLFNIYKDLIQRYKSKMNNINPAQREISVDLFKIEDKMEMIKKKIAVNEVFRFSDIISECKYKIEVVVTFIAMLELIKLKEINVVQDKSFSNIIIKRG
ncbi:segregation/condensation protein A [Clostridium sp. DL1XJH146]